LYVCYKIRKIKKRVAYCHQTLKKDVKKMLFFYKQQKFPIFCRNGADNALLGGEAKGKCKCKYIVQMFRLENSFKGPLREIFQLAASNLDFGCLCARRALFKSAKSLKILAWHPHSSLH
jgi:hypothetical protein